MSLLSMDSSGSSRVPSMDRVTALYRAHIKFVWGVLWRARMPVADVKDLAQDAFIVVLRKVRAQDHPPLQSEDEERAWLYRITKYELDNYRTRARFRQLESMDDRTNDFPDPQNEHARLENRETLILLLESIQLPGAREVFELVELEGFSVPHAAKTLDISEPNAYRRLRVAREHVAAAAAKLKRDELAGRRKKSALLMSVGVVPWVKLRGLQDPPAGTVEEIWERIQATMAELDREQNGSATPPPPGLHARPQVGLLKILAGPLKSPWFNLVSACLGGAIVALLFLLRPNTKLVPFQVPVPIFVVTSSPPASAPLPAPSSPPLTPPTDVTAPVDGAIDDEAELIRRARADFAKGDRQKMLEALTAYERRFPKGRLRNLARSMRASPLPDASAR